MFKVEWGTEEAKENHLKNYHYLAFKTEKPFISWVSFMRSYSRNNLLSTRCFLPEAYSRKRGVAKLSVWISKILKLASSFSWVGSYSQLTCKNAFEGIFQQKQIGLLEKKFLTQKCYIKTLSKTYKILKNIFGFDHQAIEYTQFTFEHVRSHKWNRHPLNIRLVCCICESSMK